MTSDGQQPFDWQSFAVSGTRVSASLTATLQSLIDVGRLPPGSRLPPERELAEILGVSRGSVREAVHELALKGLVDRSPRRGTVVLDRSSGLIVGSLLTRLSGEGRSMLEVMDLRAAIEPPIAARAAVRATRADIRRLAELIAAIDEGVPRSAAARLDAEFHAAVAAASHNQLLSRLHELTSECR